jgi:hypothetical protein
MKPERILREKAKLALRIILTQNASLQFAI